MTAKISMTPLNRLTSKDPVWCNIIHYISYVNRVVADFVLNFPNFHYMATRFRVW